MLDWIVSFILAVALWLTLHGFEPGHIVAGFFGSVARSIVAKSGTFAERIVGGFTGSLFAVYFTPIVCLFLGIPDPQIASAVAFSIGLIGMYVAEAVINVAKKYAKNPAGLKEFIRDMILRLLSPKE